MKWERRPALRLPGQFSALAGKRILDRLRSLARLIGREPVVLLGWGSPVFYSG